MKLVPTLEAEGHKNLPNGDFDDTRFSPSFFGGGGGGDQLTAARIHGAQVVAQTHKNILKVWFL